jgi:hypothetical protein
MVIFALSGKRKLFVPVLLEIYLIPMNPNLRRRLANRFLLSIYR